MYDSEAETVVLALLEEGHGPGQWSFARWRDYIHRKVSFMTVLEADFDREAVSHWLARRYSAEELAQRILGLSGLRFSARVRDELADTLSSLSGVVLGRELVRNACSLDEFPDYVHEVEPPPPGSAVGLSRGPTPSLLAHLAAG